MSAEIYPCNQHAIQEINVRGTYSHRCGGPISFSLPDTFQPFTLQWVRRSHHVDWDGKEEVEVSPYAKVEVCPTRAHDFQLHFYRDVV